MKANDLERRTVKFSTDIALLLQKIQGDVINKPLISQLIRSATSIGANYHEAGGASSKKDFKNKIYICKKECRETKYWLEILANIHKGEKEELRTLWKEAQELTMIFQKIINSCK